MFALLGYATAVQVSAGEDALGGLGVLAANVDARR